MTRSNSALAIAAVLISLGSAAITTYSFTSTRSSFDAIKTMILSENADLLHLMDRQIRSWKEIHDLSEDSVRRASLSASIKSQCSNRKGVLELRAQFHEQFNRRDRLVEDDRVRSICREPI